MPFACAGIGAVNLLGGGCDALIGPEEIRIAVVPPLRAGLS